MKSDKKERDWKRIVLLLVIGIPACVLAYWIMYTVDYPPITWLRWIAKDDEVGVALMRSVKNAGPPTSSR